MLFETTFLDFMAINITFCHFNIEKAKRQKGLNRKSTNPIIFAGSNLCEFLFGTSMQAPHSIRCLLYLEKQQTNPSVLYDGKGELVNPIVLFGAHFNRNKITNNGEARNVLPRLPQKVKRQMPESGHRSPKISGWCNWKQMGANSCFLWGQSAVHWRRRKDKNVV